jgi:hypothetical protein
VVRSFDSIGHRRLSVDELAQMKMFPRMR